MSRRRSMMALLALIMVVALIVSACGEGTAKDPSNTDSGNNDSNSVSGSDATSAVPEFTVDEPVTIVFHSQSTMEEEVFQKQFVEPVKAVYPNVNLELSLGGDLADYIASGTVPDILYSYTGPLMDWVELKSIAELDPLIKKYNMDIGRFDKAAIETVQLYSDKNAILGLPYALNMPVMYYNKDIFDRYDVPYPTDGMTWDELIQLGRQLTHVEDNTQFHGILVDSISRLIRQRANDVINFDTLKANLLNDEFRLIFNTAKAIYEAGGHDMSVGEARGVPPVFINEERIGILTGVTSQIANLGIVEENGMNWDVAQFPSHTDRPDIAGYMDGQYLYITETSKHKDLAFKLLEIWTNDENQLNLARGGTVSSLSGSMFIEQFGADTPYLEGKSLQSIFKAKIVAEPRPSKYNTKVLSILRVHFNSYIKGEVDVNEALRQAEDEVNQYIASDI